MELQLDDDPNLPSIGAQAQEHVPIFIPWVSHKAIAFGTGFDSSAASHASTDLGGALRPTALWSPSRSSKDTYRFQTAEGNGSFRQSSSMHSATSYEHMDFKGSVSVGGKFLGATARGAYAKDVYNNDDASKVSLQSSVRVGMITPTKPSSTLTPHPFNLLSTDPVAFYATYGDYYLGGLTIGADTATFLSTRSSLDLRAEMKSIQVQARFLGKTKTLVNRQTSSHSAAMGFDITFSGFDTLSAYQLTLKAEDRPGFARVREEATKNVAGGVNLDKRVREVIEQAGLGSLDVETLLSEEQAKRIWKFGLVVELMFLPYAGLRDYVSATVNAKPRSLL